MVVRLRCRKWLHCTRPVKLDFISSYVYSVHKRPETNYAQTTSHLASLPTFSPEFRTMHNLPSPLFPSLSIPSSIFVTNTLPTATPFPSARLNSPLVTNPIQSSSSGTSGYPSSSLSPPGYCIGGSCSRDSARRRTRWGRGVLSGMRPDGLEVVLRV